MNFFQHLISLVESLFLHSSPEYQLKKKLRGFENDLAANPPGILKKGFLQPNFAQALLILYTQTRALKDILTLTLFNERAPIAARFADMLMFAAVTGETREDILSLSYENRKKNLEESDPSKKVMSHQRMLMEKILQKLAPDKNFLQMEKIVRQMEQLYDICTYDYVNALKLFSHSFSGLTPSAQYDFQPVAQEDAENICMDLYFLTADFMPNASTARVLDALQQAVPENERKKTVIPETPLKQISAVLTKILSTSTQQKLLAVIKKKADLEPEKALYTTKHAQQYCTRLRSLFETDTKRLEMELHDERTRTRLQELFGNSPLLTMTRYNTETNELFKQQKTAFFTWIQPLQILKTFVVYFLTEEITGFLNILAVEGFFTDQIVQTSYATSVYNCIEIHKHLENFEALFEKNGETDYSLISRLLSGAQMNVEFAKQLKQIIETANMRAEKLLTSSANQISLLNAEMHDLLADSRKSAPEIVSNIKILFGSYRNRQAVETLEKQLPLWVKFLEIMGDYIIIK